MFSLIVAVLLTASAGEAEASPPKEPTAPRAPSTPAIPTAEARQTSGGAPAATVEPKPASPTADKVPAAQPLPATAAKAPTTVKRTPPAVKTLAPSAVPAPIASAPVTTAPASASLSQTQSANVNSEGDMAKLSPPSLTENALCEELRRGAKDRQSHSAQLDSERKALAKERERLTQLAADVEKARKSLKEETARLEQLIKKAPAEKAERAPPRDPAKPPPVLEKGSVEGFAKAMHTMKPEQGAQLLAKLDRTLASEVLRKMKPADVGAVMEKLRPELAAELVSMMTAAPVASSGKEGQP